jgi:hypothetical protein
VNEEMSAPPYGREPKKFRNIYNPKTKQLEIRIGNEVLKRKGSKPVFSAAQRDDMEEVPIRRQEGGITAVKKLENTLSELVGINPKDVEWASSLSEEMYPGEELDGRGDAARHIALGSLIAKAEHPNAAEALSVLREYIPIPDSGRKMDMFNNDLGMTLTGSKPEIKKQIRELIENNTAMYMELDESQKMRGY